MCGVIAQMIFTICKQIPFSREVFIRVDSQEGDKLLLRGEEIDQDGTLCFKLDKISEKELIEWASKQ